MVKPMFYEGQRVMLVDDAQIWGKPFRGRIGTVEMIQLAVHLYAPREWIYTVRIDDLPYSVTCGGYALKPLERSA